MNGMTMKEIEICFSRKDSNTPEEVNITHLWNDIMSLLNSSTKGQGIMIRIWTCARTLWRNTRERGLTRSKGMIQEVGIWNLSMNEFIKISKNARRQFWQYVKGCFLKWLNPKLERLDESTYSMGTGIMSLWTLRIKVWID